MIATADRRRTFLGSQLEKRLRGRLMIATDRYFVAALRADAEKRLRGRLMIATAGPTIPRKHPRRGETAARSPDDRDQVARSWRRPNGGGETAARSPDDRDDKPTLTEGFRKRRKRLRGRLMIATSACSA